MWRRRRGSLRPLVLGLSHCTPSRCRWPQCGDKPSLPPAGSAEQWGTQESGGGLLFSPLREINFPRFPRCEVLAPATSEWWREQDCICLFLTPHCSLSPLPWLEPPGQMAMGLNLAGKPSSPLDSSEEGVSLMGQFSLDFCRPWVQLWGLCECPLIACHPPNAQKSITITTKKDEKE